MNKFSLTLIAATIAMHCLVPTSAHAMGGLRNVVQRGVDTLKDHAKDLEKVEKATQKPEPKPTPTSNSRTVGDMYGEDTPRVAPPGRNGPNPFVRFNNNHPLNIDRVKMPEYFGKQAPTMGILRDSSPVIFTLPGNRFGSQLRYRSYR